MTDKHEGTPSIPMDFAQNLESTRSRAGRLVPAFGQDGLDCWALYTRYVGAEVSSGPLIEEVKTLVAKIAGGKGSIDSAFGNAGYMIRIISMTPFNTAYGLERMMRSFSIGRDGATDYRVATVLGYREPDRKIEATEALAKSLTAVENHWSSPRPIPFFEVDEEGVLSIDKAKLGNLATFGLSIGYAPGRSVSPFGRSRHMADALTTLQLTNEEIDQIEGSEPDAAGLLMG